MNPETIYEVIKKLIGGSIEPVGSSHVDDRIFENLKTTCEVVEMLLTDLHQVEPYKHNHQHSMRKCGDYVSDFFDSCNIKE